MSLRQTQQQQQDLQQDLSSKITEQKMDTWVECLPSSLASDIFTRLSAKTICRSMCVCKPWMHFLENPDFFLHHRTQSRKKPSLMYFTNEEHQNFKISLVDSAGRDYVIKSQFDDGFLNFKFANSDLLCFLTLMRRLMIYNVTSQETVLLPHSTNGRNRHLVFDTVAAGFLKSRIEYKFVRFYTESEFQIDIKFQDDNDEDEDDDNYYYGYVSSDSEDSDSEDDDDDSDDDDYENDIYYEDKSAVDGDKGIVDGDSFTASSNVNQIKCEIFTLRHKEGANGSWRRIGDSPCRSLSDEFYPPCVNGIIFWIVLDTDHRNRRRCILSLDLETEEFRFLSLPECFLALNPSSLYLFELRGCLCVAKRWLKTKNNIKPASTIDVWKMTDLRNGVWVQEYSIDLSELGDFNSTEASVLFADVDDREDLLVFMNKEGVISYNSRDRSVKIKEELSLLGVEEEYRRHPHLHYDNLFSFGPK